MVTIHTFLDTGKRAIWNNNNTRNINNNKFKGTAKNALLLLSIQSMFTKQQNVISLFKSKNGLYFVLSFL